MAKRAWGSISPTTIKNCWNHTDIQRPRLPIITLRPPHPPMPANLAAVHDSASNICEVATIPDKHNEVEEELLDLVAQLKVWRCIIGEPYSLEELLDPVEEREIRQSLDVVDDGDMEIQ